MAEPVARSPLSPMIQTFAEIESQSDGGLVIREVPLAAQVTVRIDSNSAAARAVADVIGGPLPVVPNTVAAHGPLDVLWLGPDEWLIVSCDRSPDELTSMLRAACRDEADANGFAVVDVSSQRTIVELSGPCARSVLARGCALDLHEASFAMGRCAQTLLAQAQVILQPVAQPETIRIFVRGSFAPYLADWLLDASSEERLGINGGLADRLVVSRS